MGDSKRVISFVSVALLVSVLLVSLGLAAHVVKTGSLGIDFYANESLSYTYTVLINNTDTTLNITQVNITLPTNVSFVRVSNSTTAGAHAFLNTSTVLTWNTTTQSLINYSSAGENRHNFTFNATVSYPGTYNITVATFNGTVLSTSYLTLRVNDTTAATSIEFAAPSQSNNTNSSGSIAANISVSDNGRYTINVTLLNSTYGIINTTAATDTSAYINFTGLTSGVYYVNASVNDTGANKNYSELRKITVDTDSPTVSLASTGSTVTSVSGDITISDNTTTVSNTCSADRTGASISVVSTTKQTLEEDDLTCGTSYNYVITCRDNVGNTGVSTSVSLTTGSCVGGSAATGGSSSTSSTTWTTTYVAPADTNLQEGYRRVLGSKERVEIKINNVKHNVGVLSTNASGATIEVASTPQKTTLNVGETKNFDLDGNGSNDISVTLNAITNGKADLTVKQIVQQTTPADNTQPAATENTPAETTESSSSSMVWIWVLIVVVIIALAVWFWMRKK